MRARKTDGTVWAWGYNGEGELGDNTINTHGTAAHVANVTGVVAVAAGD